MEKSVVIGSSLIAILFFGSLLFLLFASEDVRLQPASYDCEVSLPGGGLYGYANNGELMNVQGSYLEPHILCDQGTFFEAGPTDNWDYASDVLPCTQKGSWYVSDSDGVWVEGSLPSTCDSLGASFYVTFDGKTPLDFPSEVVGTSFGSPTYGGGYSGAIGDFALSMDGIDDFVAFNNIDFLSGDFSFSFFARPDFSSGSLSDGAFPPFLFFLSEDSSEYFAVSQHFSGNTAFAMSTINGSEWAYDSFAFSSGEWIHVAGQYNSSSDRINLYVDGVLAQQGSGKGNGGISMPGSLYFGNSYTNYYDGRIDEVTFYPHILSEQDILSLCGTLCEEEEEEVEGLLLFVTESTWIGNFSRSDEGDNQFSVQGEDGLARADYICGRDDHNPDDDLTFRALLGVTGEREVGKNWVLEEDQTYILDGGILVGSTDEDAWFDFPLDHAMGEDDLLAFTGLNFDGEATSTTCDSWESGERTEEATVGFTNSTQAIAIRTSRERDCDEARAIICVQYEGGSGRDSCIPDWQIGTWSNAADSCGTRLVTDRNSCGVLAGKPPSTKTCSSEPLNTCGNGVCDIGESLSCAEDCGDPTPQERVCGDGDFDSSVGEQCDDGNNQNGDGCSSLCTIEDAWSCDTLVEPTSCVRQVSSNTWILITVAILVMVALALIGLVMLKHSRGNRDMGVRMDSVKSTSTSSSSSKKGPQYFDPYTLR